MRTITFYLKPARPHQKVVWNGPNADDPSLSNHGTKDQPVWFSTGAINTWIWEISKRYHDRPQETLYFLFYHQPGDYAVGPASAQGADVVWVQKPKVKCQVFASFVGESKYNTTYHVIGKEYSKEDADKITAGLEFSAMFTPVGFDLDYIDVAGIKIDSRFKQYGYYTEPGSITRGLKAQPIHLRAKNLNITDCWLTGSGGNANLKDPTVLLAESFPLGTFATDPTLLLISSTSLPTVSPAHLIENCLVDDFTSVNGAYATMVMPCMFRSKLELPLFYNDTIGAQQNVPIAAMVRNCTIVGCRNVNGAGTAGLTNGPYASQGVFFCDNLFVDCMLGFNVDTGVVQDFWFTDNVLRNCNLIGQLGSPTGALKGGEPDVKRPPYHRNFNVSRNKMQIFKHDIKLSAENVSSIVKAGGLYIRNNAAGIVFKDNTFGYRYNKAISKEENYYTPIALSSKETYEVPGYYGLAGPKNVVLDKWIASDPKLTNRVRPVLA